MDTNRASLKGMPEILACEELLANSIVVWFDEMIETYVNDPKSHEARMLVFDAFAIAMQHIAQRDEHPQAILDHLKANL